MNNYETIIRGMKNAKSHEEYTNWALALIRYLKGANHANHS